METRILRKEIRTVLKFETVEILPIKHSRKTKILSLSHKKILNEMDYFYWQCSSNGIEKLDIRFGLKVQHQLMATIKIDRREK